MSLLVWDFDGTIIDSLSVHRRAAAEYCERHRLPLPSADSLKHSFGNTQWTGFEEWTLPLSKQDEHRFAIYDIFYRLQKQSPELLQPIDGVIDMIRSYHAENITQAIVTSRPLTPLLDMLDHLRLGNIFACQNAGDCAERLGLRDKPAPDKLLHVMDNAGVSPGDTIVIGDSVMDIKMAAAAQTPVIGVTWGVGAEAELSASGASLIAHTAHELSQAIAKLRHGHGHAAKPNLKIGNNQL